MFSQWICNCGQVKMPINSTVLPGMTVTCKLCESSYTHWVDGYYWLFRKTQPSPLIVEVCNDYRNVAPNNQPRWSVYSHGTDECASLTTLMEHGATLVGPLCAPNGAQMPLRGTMSDWVLQTVRNMVTDPTCNVHISRGTREVTKPGDTVDSYEITAGLAILIEINGGAKELRLELERKEQDPMNEFISEADLGNTR